MSKLKTATRLNYVCPHCDREVGVTDDVLGETVTCPLPDCGRAFCPEAPVAQTKDLPGNPQKSDGEPQDFTEEEVLQVIHPAMFRNHPLWFIGIGLVLVGGLAATVWSVLGEASGLQIPGVVLVVTSLLTYFVWWVSTRFVTLKLTDERTIFWKGLISRQTSEVRHDDVRNLQVHQSVLQRLLGVGEIAISSSGQDDFEIRAAGVPRPADIAETIRGYQ